MGLEWDVARQDFKQQGAVAPRPAYRGERAERKKRLEARPRVVEQAGAGASIKGAGALRPGVRSAPEGGHQISNLIDAHHHVERAAAGVSRVVDAHQFKLSGL